MALNSNQRVVTLGRLYQAQSLGDALFADQLVPSIWVDSGSVDIRSSQSATQPTALADMTLSVDDTAVIDKTIVKIPKYLAFTQNSGTSTEVIVTGVELIDLGAIA